MLVVGKEDLNFENPPEGCNQLLIKSKFLADL